MIQIEDDDLHKIKRLLDAGDFVGAKTAVDAWHARRQVERRRVSPGTTPPYVPRTVHEIYSRFVVPVLSVNRPPQPPSHVSPTSRSSTNPAEGLGDARIEVEFAPDLLHDLARHLRDRMAPGDHTSPLVVEWNRRYQAFHQDFSIASIGYEEDLSGAALVSLALPINLLLKDPLTWKAGAPPGGSPPKWQRSLQTTSAVGVTDWICITDDKSAIAVKEWKRKSVVSTESMTQAWTQAAVRRGRQPLFVWQEGGKVLNNGGFTTNMAKAIGQLWSQAHFNKCRQLILFNSDAALFFYLASTHQLLISNSVKRTAGQDMHAATLATLLLATACEDLPLPRGADIHVNYLSMTTEQIQSMEPMEDDVPAAPSVDEGDPNIHDVVGHEIHDDYEHTFRKTPPFKNPGVFDQLKAIKASTSEPSVLLIGPKRSYGAVWTAFSASLVSGPSALESVLLQWDPRFWNVSECASEESPTASPITAPHFSPTECAGSSVGSTVEVGPLIVRVCVPTPDDDTIKLLKHITREAAVYESAAGVSLQGTVLPQWHGVFVPRIDDGSPMWITLLEDVGPAVAWESDNCVGQVPPVWIPDTLRKYDALHDAGIAHGDLALRHVRVGNGFARHDVDGGLRRRGEDLGLNRPGPRASGPRGRREGEEVRRWLDVWVPPT